MDPIATLAATAIAASLPHLMSLGKEAAKGAAGAAGKSIWEWVRDKLGSDAKDVRDLESEPGVKWTPGLGPWIAEVKV